MCITVTTNYYLTFRQDGANLEPNARSINGVLHIDDAVMENQGVYICHSNVPEVVPVSVLLTVNLLGTRPPFEVQNVTVDKQRLIIPTGDFGTVECVPHGFPLPTVKWSKVKYTFYL